MAGLGPPLGVAALAVAACAAIWVGDPTTPGGPLPLCPTKWLLGIDCPGCGTMRMLYSLMHGDVLAALHFNALALVALVFLVWAYGAWTYGRVVGRSVFRWHQNRVATRTTLVLVLIWFVIRNIPVAPFTGLHV